MSEQLAREIVRTAHKMEEEEKKRQVFAELVYRGGSFEPAYKPWMLCLPTGMSTSFGCVSDALNTLSKNGLVVDYKEVKAWIECVKKEKSSAA